MGSCPDYGSSVDKPTTTREGGLPYVESLRQEQGASLKDRLTRQKQLTMNEDVSYSTAPKRILDLKAAATARQVYCLLNSVARSAFESRDPAPLGGDPRSKVLEGRLLSPRPGSFISDATK